jgi:large subunit ribosomal protein L13
MSAKSIARSWHLVDASDMVIGKLATKVASLLQGKHKRGYTPNLDNGDIVVVVNAGKVVATGKKHLQKVYTRYSGYPGGLREVTLERMIIKNPQEVVRRAISGMLPKNKLRSRRLARLHIFKDSVHPYSQHFTSFN